MLEEAMEVKSLRRIITSYLNYPYAADEDVRRWERSYNELSPAHKALLPHYPLKFKTLRQCIALNSHFIFGMLLAFEPPFDMRQDDDIPDHVHHSSPNEDQFSSERNICSVLSASTSINACACACTVTNHRSGSNSIQSPTEILTILEGKKGDASEAENSSSENDRDLEKCKHERDKAADPNGNDPLSAENWLSPSLQACVPLVDVDKVRCIIRNIVRDWATEGKKERDECYKPILEELDALFPNRSEESAGITEGFSMCGGDFVEGYSEPSQVGAWDVVVTCFFIDTAHNIIEYIEIISRVLKDGGVWINLGPLLYHFADMYGQEDVMSVELSLLDVKSVALHYGFVLEKETTIETTYTTNSRSMMQNRYFAALWTMRKMHTETKHSAS